MKNREHESRGEVVSHIVDLMADHKIKFEIAISEVDISNWLGYEGRSPMVREALAVLVRDAIMGVKSGVGYGVRRVSVTEAEEVYNFRGRTQKHILGILASDNQCSMYDTSLDGILNNLNLAAYDGDAKEFNRHDTNFQKELPRVAQILTATAAIEAYSNKLRVFRIERPYELDGMGKLASSYNGLMEQLKAKDPVKVIEAYDTLTSKHKELIR